MADNKFNRKFTKLTTPKVKSGFANVTRESPFGGYGVDLFFEDNSTTEAFFKELEQVHAANVTHEKTENGAKGKDTGYGKHDIRDSEPTFVSAGEFRKLKLKGNRPPRIYDSNGALTTLTHELPVESEVRVNITAASYNFAGKIGTTLYVDSIQIINMPERKPLEPRIEFDAVEGNYVTSAGADIELTLD